MILKALYDYYNRSSNDIAPMDMAYINFYYSIVIDEKGNFIRLEPLGNKDGLPLLTFRPEERTSAPVPHCLGDNATYILGLKEVKDKENFDFSKELNANKKNFVSFKEDVMKLYQALPNNKYVKAIQSFYSHFSLNTILNIRQDPHWKDFCKYLGKNITFSINGIQGYAACDSEVIQEKKKGKNNNNKEMICLITGGKEKPVNTTYSSFIIGSKSNAKLVAFQISSGYDSYGKKMGLNAPISEEAEFKYTTALLKLLSKGSHNIFMIGTRTFVFWASSKSEAASQAEDSLFELLGYSEEEQQQDDPNAKIEQVRKVFSSIYSGSLKTSLEDRFYILGLAPNIARIAVVYWSESSLKDFAEKILQHFEDMEVVDTRKDKRPYMGIKDILSAVTLNGKQSDVTPNLPESIVQSIFQGTSYPYTLLSACIRRIRAESADKNAIRIGRIAIIKAYLNRINDNNKKIEIMLDKSNNNPGYLCGRLFAVLDKIQEDANGINSIRERYMNAASATPSSVFATILNLSSHHLEKLASEGKKVFYEKLKQEIIDKIPANGFPVHLNLQDQGRFFIGYYHQRQDFFTKKEEDK